MRLLIVVLLLFYGVESIAKDDFKGLLIDQGYISSDVENPEYTAIGLFYLSSGNVKLGLKYMDLAESYSDMLSLSVTRLISINRKGLYFLMGGETLDVYHGSRGYPGVTSASPIFGLGVFVTRRKFLSQVELSVHYPRVEVNFSLGY